MWTGRSRGSVLWCGGGGREFGENRACERREGPLIICVGVCVRTRVHALCTLILMTVLAANRALKDDCSQLVCVRTCVCVCAHVRVCVRARAYVCV